MVRKGLNSLIILRVWIIWKHCNQCIFDGGNPNMVEALTLAGEKRQQWVMVIVLDIRFVLSVLFFYRFSPFCYGRKCNSLT
jgi:dolichyl-phosphate-mannose--protein O-mannosyl transferase